MEHSKLNIDLSIARYNTPYHEPGRVTQSKYVQYVTKDGYQYPDELIRLATQCPLHGSILKSKSAYITGDGLLLSQMPLCNF